MQPPRLERECTSAMRTRCGSLLAAVLLLAGVGPAARCEVVSVGSDAKPSPAEPGPRGPRATAPGFAPRQRTAVRALAGSSATLDCQVLHLGDKAVSWVRSRDLQILAHGGAVFTADARVSAPAASARSHALRIDRLRHADAGRYECQLNTEPKTSLFFELIVADEEEALAETTAEPQPVVTVWALGDSAVRAARGAATTLSCAASRIPAVRAPPLNIRWLKDGQPLTLQAEGSEWQVAGAAYAESRLRLAALRTASAGTYSCVAGSSAGAEGTAAAADIVLYVEENMGDVEVMQRDQSVTGSGPRASSPGLAVAALVTMLLTLAAFR